ncbi:MAG: hydroxymethylbilane synthase [Armatimonadota bacterium]|nr:hydroxymethylbilane synthase [Armatimonadota bacterium]
MRELIVGSRGSRLALAQTREVIEQLGTRNPGVSFRTEIIRTAADKEQRTSLTQFGRTGVFVREIEQALLAGRIDLAVHSAKDVPSEMDPQLCIAAYPARANPADVFVSRVGPLLEVPRGARIGTSSARRRAQLMAVRADLVPAEIRGNIDTRLAKVERGDYDAVILAYAGLARLGLTSVITDELDLDSWLPAAGQGALAVQCRTDDPVRELIAQIDDWATRACVTAERAFIRELRAGCLAPVGVLATIKGENMEIRGLVAAPDGSVVVRYSEVGDRNDPESLGAHLANRFLRSEAREFLRSRSGTLTVDNNANED